MANFDHGGTGFGEFNYAGEACEKFRKPSFFVFFVVFPVFDHGKVVAVSICAIISSKSTPISKRFFALDSLIQF